MTNTLWIVLGISVLAVIGFVMAIRSQLQTNREIEKKIDYSKLRPQQDEDDDK